LCIISNVQVEAAVHGLFTLIKNSSTLPKNELWDEATPIHLVVTAVKMGVGPKRVVRMYVFKVFFYLISQNVFLMINNYCFL